jgi:hypothetical protein
MAAAPRTWGPDDYDVFDGNREVGRIRRMDAATELWWWGVSFMVTHRKSYETAGSLEEVAAFKAEYEWPGRVRLSPTPRAGFKPATALLPALDRPRAHHPDRKKPRPAGLFLK